MVPFELGIANSIEEEVQNVDNSPFLILAIVEKFEHILKRKGVQSHLALFLMSFKDVVKGLLRPMQIAVEDGFFDRIDRVQSVFECRQIKRKVQKILTGYSPMDVDGDDILQQCSELTIMCDKVENNLFQTWLEESKSKLRELLHSLESTERLIESDSLNGFKVTFHNDIAKLIDQERKLQLLGFHTQTLVKDVSVAKKYYEVGAFLNRIILFRNHVERQMSSEQLDLIKPMLMEFDNFIRKSDHNQKSITWTNEIECRRFATDLFKIANKVRNEVDRISDLHKNLTDKTSMLFKHDLLSERSLWLQHMRTVEGCLQNKEMNIHAGWLVYWESQVYKVFEACYSKGLVKLVNFMTGIQCEMILRKDNRVEIIPSISEIRTKIFEQIRAFAEYPLKYDSRYSKNTKFGSIPMMNETTIAQSYMAFEECLSRLRNLVDQYSKRMIPVFEVSQYAEKHCHKAESYMKAIQYLLSHKQKIEDWSEIESIFDIIKVSTSKLATAVKNRLDFYIHCLNQHLHQRTMNEYNEVKEYISSTKLLLLDMPHDVSSIQETESLWESARIKIPRIEELAVSCTKKIDLILQTQKSADLSVKKKEMKLMKVRSIIYI